MALLWVYTVVGALFTVLMFFSAYTARVWMLGMLVMANIGFAGCLVFYNSFLPHIAPRNCLTTSAQGFRLRLCRRGAAAAGPPRPYPGHPGHRDSRPGNPAVHRLRGPVVVWLGALDPEGGAGAGAAGAAGAARGWRAVSPAGPFLGERRAGSDPP